MAPSRLALILAALAAFATAPASAQSLRLDKAGGGIGSSASFALRGPASEFCALLFALGEQATPIPQLNVTMGIPLDFAGTAIGMPGFAGFLSTQGARSASTPIPMMPELAGLAIPFQALTIPAPGQTTTQSVVSNVVRLTPQLPGTFAPCLTQPSVPIVGGSFATNSAGEVTFAGGSGPIAQAYESSREEWSLAGAALSFGLL